MDLQGSHWRGMEVPLIPAADPSESQPQDQHANESKKGVRPENIPQTPTHTQLQPPTALAESPSPAHLSMLPALHGTSASRLELSSTCQASQSGPGKQSGPHSSQLSSLRPPLLQDPGLVAPITCMFENHGEATGTDLAQESGSNPFLSESQVTF